MYRSIRILLLTLILVMAAYCAHEVVNDLARVQAEEAETGSAWIEKEGVAYRDRLYISFPPKSEQEGREFIAKEAKHSGSVLFYIKYLDIRFSPDGKLLSDGQWMFLLPENTLFWGNLPGYNKEAPHRYASAEEESYQQIVFLQERYGRKEDYGISYFTELDLDDPPLGSTPHEGRWGLLTNEGSRIRRDLKENFPTAEIHLDPIDYPSITWNHHQLRWLLLFLFFFIYAMFLSLQVEKERNIRLLLGRRLGTTYGQLYFLPFFKTFVLYIISWQFFLLVFLKFRFPLFSWASSHLKMEWKVILLFFAVIVSVQLLFFMVSEGKRRKGAKASFELPGFLPVLFALLLVFLSVSIPLFVKNTTTLIGLVKTQGYLSEHSEKKENTGFNQAALAFKNKEDNLNQKGAFEKEAQANRELRLFLEDYHPLVFDTRLFTMSQLQELNVGPSELRSGPPWIILNQRMFDSLSLPLEKEPDRKDFVARKDLLLILPKGKKLGKEDVMMLPVHSKKVQVAHLKESFTMQDPTFLVGEIRNPYFAVVPDEDLLDTLNFPALFFEKLNEIEREEILAFIDEQEREPRWAFFEDNEKRMVSHEKKLSEEIKTIMNTTASTFAFILLALWFLELFSHDERKKELALHLLLGKKVRWIYLKQRLPLLFLEFAALLLLWGFMPKLSRYLELGELWPTLLGIALLQLLLGYGFFLFILKKGVKYMLVEGEF